MKDVISLGSLKVVAFRLKNLNVSETTALSRGIANLLSQFKLRDTIIEIKARRESVSVQDIVKRLERDIAVLRIILESDPSNIRVERKLKTYEEVYKAYLNGVPPARVSLYVIGFSTNEDELKEEVGKFVEALAAMIGAEVERLKGKDIIRKAILPLKEKGEVTSAEVFGSVVVNERLPPPLIGPIVLGYEARTGEIVGLDEEKIRRHVLLVGSTGSGKTTLLATLAVRIRDIYEAKVISIDPKGDLADMLKREGFEVSEDPRADVINTDDQNVIERVVEYVKKEMKISKRGSRLHTVLIIDEAWKLGVKKFEPLLREGRSRGIGLIIATHSLKDIDTKLLVNLNTRIIMRTDRNDLKGISKEILDEVLTLVKGEAVVIWGRNYLRVKLYPLRRLLQ